MVVTPANSLVRFGVFEFDRNAGQLSRNGIRLKLSQQPLQVLCVLLERPGEVVSRKELQKLLWSSDVFVDFDHGLNKSVQKLREALGDSPDSPRYIETIPRTGYRFIAPVTKPTQEGLAAQTDVPSTTPRTPPGPVGLARDKAKVAMVFSRWLRNNCSVRGRMALHAAPPAPECHPFPRRHPSRQPLW